MDGITCLLLGMFAVSAACLPCQSRAKGCHRPAIGTFVHACMHAAILHTMGTKSNTTRVCHATT